MAGRALVGRALDAYGKFRSTGVDPVAPVLLCEAPTANDDKAVALLHEHDPLASGDLSLSIDGLAIDPDAVVLSELIVAASIHAQECDLPGDRSRRMEIAVLTRSQQIGSLVGAGEFHFETVLAALLEDCGEAQRMLLLIEAMASNPFAPYQIAWLPEHELNAIAYLAKVIGLPPQRAVDIADTFAKAASAHKRISAKRAGMAGVAAAAALGGAGFLAAPAVGAALGSAAGLSGAAATSYGLGLLGSLGGATAPGSLTAGGMWLVAQAGATAGVLTGAGGSLLHSMGAGQAQNEIIKLQVTFKMVLVDLQRNDAAALEVAELLEDRLYEIKGELEDFAEIDDPGSTHVEDLMSNAESLQSALTWMTDNHMLEDDGSVHISTSDLRWRMAQIRSAVGSGKNQPASGEDFLAQMPIVGQTAIEDRITCRFALNATLDRWDVIAAVAAGVTAAVVDALIVADPSNGITNRLRNDHAVRNGNWLEQLAKVPFDPSMAPGMTPSTHRVLTPGHDPLLGLVFGTRDILQSTMTRSDVSGAVQFVDRPQVSASSDVVSALMTQLAHLASDIVTPAGLPLPGWTALTTTPTTAETAVKMYARGYDTWHLAPMMLPVAAVHAVGSVYWAMRDEEGEQISQARQDSFTLIALGIASIGDLGAMLATKGNPLALNYGLWLDLARRTAKEINRRSRRSVRVTVDDTTRNQHILNHGWTKLLSG